MSDVNVKLISPADPRTYAEKSSPYLLNVEVLETLKQAIKQAKDANSMDARSDQE
jgi:hypothetical protein